MFGSILNMVFYGVIILFGAIQALVIMAFIYGVIVSEVSNK